jgi:hypothetical protein
MATIVTRAGKGEPLTHAEVDANFNNLNVGKPESVQNIFVEGSRVVSTNYTVGATKNVLSVGPIDIASGVEVDIADGGVWLVV